MRDGKGHRDEKAFWAPVGVLSAQWVFFFLEIQESFIMASTMLPFHARDVCLRHIS